MQSSCINTNKVLNVNICDKDKVLEQLSKVKYSDSELAYIIKFEGTIQELKDKYPIECIRKTSFGYRVSYLGTNHIVAIEFDDYGNKSMSNIYQISPSKEHFDDITKNELLEDIQRIDPYGDYIFLYTGVNAPRYSYHFTEDGYLITIEYDVSNYVLNVMTELI